MASKVECSKCGATVAMRVTRIGFLQQKVYPMLGIYPWKCGACGVSFLNRRRAQVPVRGPRTVEVPASGRRRGTAA